MSFFGVILFILFFQSCCEDEVIEPEEFPRLINLEVGNFWVYEYGFISDDGEFVYSRTDSVVVMNEIFEVGVQLYELSGSFGFETSEKSYVYDSLNYLIAYPSREILFTTDTSYVATIDNALIFGEQKVEREEGQINVPAGDFNTYNYKGTFTAKDPDYPHGELESNVYYSNEVGLIKMDAPFVSNGNVVEKRLLSFGKI